MSWGYQVRGLPASYLSPGKGSMVEVHRKPRRETPEADIPVQTPLCAFEQEGLCIVEAPEMRRLVIGDAIGGIIPRPVGRSPAIIT